MILGNPGLLYAPAPSVEQYRADQKHQEQPRKTGGFQGVSVCPVLREKQCWEYNAAGLPNVTGRASGFQMTATAGALSFVAGGNNLVYNIESVVAMYNLSVDASRSNPIYGLSDTVMPSSANLPVALYLGQPAEI